MQGSVEEGVMADSQISRASERVSYLSDQIVELVERAHRCALSSILGINAIFFSLSVDFFPAVDADLLLVIDFLSPTQKKVLAELFWVCIGICFSAVVYSGWLNSSVPNFLRRIHSLKSGKKKLDKAATIRHAEIEKYYRFVQQLIIESQKVRELSQYLFNGFMIYSLIIGWLGLPQLSLSDMSFFQYRKLFSCFVYIAFAVFDRHHEKKITSGSGKIRLFNAINLLQQLERLLNRVEIKREVNPFGNSEYTIELPHALTIKLHRKFPELKLTNDDYMRILAKALDECLVDFRVVSNPEKPNDFSFVSDSSLEDEAKFRAVYMGYLEEQLWLTKQSEILSKIATALDQVLLSAQTEDDECYETVYWCLGSYTPNPDKVCHCLNTQGIPAGMLSQLTRFLQTQYGDDNVHMNQERLTLELAIVPPHLVKRIAMATDDFIQKVRQRKTVMSERQVLEVEETQSLGIQYIPDSEQSPPKWYSRQSAKALFSALPFFQAVAQSSLLQSDDSTPFSKEYPSETIYQIAGKSGRLTGKIFCLIPQHFANLPKHELTAFRSTLANKADRDRITRQHGETGIVWIGDTTLKLKALGINGNRRLEATKYQEDSQGNQLWIFNTLRYDSHSPRQLGSKVVSHKV